MPETKSYFTIDDMKLALLEIISQIKNSDWSPEIILSINRGGCVPGVYLSHLIEVPHKVIDVQLRDSANKPNLFKLENSINSYSNILIIDDINDTGATFNLIKNITGIENLNICYASLVENKTSSFKSDFKGKIIDKSLNPVWIVFPWEKC